MTDDDALIDLALEYLSKQQTGFYCWSLNGTLADLDQLRQAAEQLLARRQEAR